MNRIRVFSLCLLPLLQAAEYPAWQAIGPWGGAARVIRLDTAKPDTLMALTMRGTGVFRSRDGAKTWTLLPAFPELANSRFDCGLIADGKWFVGTAPGGLWRSSDEGENWRVVAGTERLSFYAIAAWPKDQRVLAAGTNEGVWMSKDGGESWRRISPKTVADLAAIVSVAFDPARAGTIYAGTPHLPWKTTNAGITWKKVHVGMFDDSDIFSIAVDPSREGRVFASACSGIYCSLNAGAAWRRVQGIPGTNRRTYVVTQSPHNRDLLFAGTSAGMWSSRDGGLLWAKLNEYVATSVEFHPVHKKLFYVSTERHGLLRTLDEGKTFEPVNEGFASRSLLALESDNGKLYAVARYEGSAGGVFVKDDVNGPWSIATRGRNFDRFVVQPGVLLGRDSDEGWLSSKDGGQNWDRTLMDEPDSGDWFETAVNPFEPKEWLRASRQGLSKSTDGGLNWRAIEMGLGKEWIRSVTFHRKRKGLCFALRQQRVFWSPDAGESWYWLPAHEEAQLAFEKLRVSAEFPGLLFAIRPNRGVYVLDLPKNSLH